jgi:hypothetical protein
MLGEAMLPITSWFFFSSHNDYRVDDDLSFCFGNARLHNIPPETNASMTPYTKFLPKGSCPCKDMENNEEANVGATVRVMDPTICTIPLIDPRRGFGAVSAMMT